MTAPRKSYAPATKARSAEPTPLHDALQQRAREWASAEPCRRAFLAELVEKASRP